MSNEFIETDSPTLSKMCLTQDSLIGVFTVSLILTNGVFLYLCFSVSHRQLMVWDSRFCLWGFSGSLSSHIESLHHGSICIWKSGGGVNLSSEPWPFVNENSNSGFVMQPGENWLASLGLGPLIRRIEIGGCVPCRMLSHTIHTYSTLKCKCRKRLETFISFQRAFICNLCCCPGHFFGSTTGTEQTL